MLKRKHKINGKAILEYIALLLFIMGAFLIFQKYIARGIAGRWKATGDFFGFGAQYDPRTTIECSWFPGTGAAGTEMWFNTDCQDANCKIECFSEPYSATTCQACLSSHGCFIDKCQPGLAP